MYVFLNKLVMTKLKIHFKMSVSGKIPLINFLVRTSIRRKGIARSRCGGGILRKRIKFWFYGFPLDIHSPCFWNIYLSLPQILICLNRAVNRAWYCASVKAQEIYTIHQSLFRTRKLLRLYYNSKTCQKSTEMDLKSFWL